MSSTIKKNPTIGDFIQTCRLVQSKGALKYGKVLIDHFTASACLVVYNHFKSIKSQEQMELLDSQTGRHKIDKFLSITFDSITC